MARTPTPANNVEFDERQEEADSPWDDSPNGNGSSAQPHRQRRRGALERTVASLLSADDDMPAEDMIMELKARFAQSRTAMEDMARKDVMLERSTAYTDVLKNKIKELKRKLLEAALELDF